MQMDPHTLKLLRWIKSKGSATAEQLVEWDLRNGKKLFDWDDPNAAHEHRLYEARVFLNRFRTIINGFRVRSFIRIPENPEQGIPEDAYYPVGVISETPAMRDFVIRDIQKRLAKMAMELKLWKLTDEERRAVLQRVEDALYG